ncbi:MAG: CvpA family protein [Flavobacteriales bacterium]|nr:CvpA family protein [Flavobacteriales bacterium]
MTNLFDIILIVPLVLTMVRGYMKGLIIEVASLVALFLGVIVGLKFSIEAGSQLSIWGLETEYNEIIAFVILLILVVIGVHLIAKSIEGIVKIVMLGFVNKLLGSVFAAIKMALIMSVLLFVVHKVDERVGFLGAEFKDGSKLYEPMVKGVYKVMPYVKEFAKPHIQDLPTDTLI